MTAIDSMSKDALMRAELFVSSVAQGYPFIDGGSIHSSAVRTSGHVRHALGPIKL